MCLLQFHNLSVHATQVNLSLMAVTDLIHFAKKLTAGTAGLHTLKLECFPKYVGAMHSANRLHAQPVLDQATAQQPA